MNCCKKNGCCKEVFFTSSCVRRKRDGMSRDWAEELRRWLQMRMPWPGVYPVQSKHTTQDAITGEEDTITDNGQAAHVFDYRRRIYNLPRRRPAWTCSPWIAPACARSWKSPVLRSGRSSTALLRISLFFEGEWYCKNHNIQRILHWHFVYIGKLDAIQALLRRFWAHELGDDAPVLWGAPRTFSVPGASKDQNRLLLPAIRKRYYPNKKRHYKRHLLARIVPSAAPR